MVHIFYTHSDKKLDSDAFSKYLKNLPPVFQTKILKYRHWQDAQRSLLGKALLMDGLYSLGLKQYFLKDIKFSNFQKPYFNNLIDFNISHSGEFVVCAICLTGKVGVDIEEIKPVPFDELKMFFSNKECNKIEQAQDSAVSFYRHWTQKEAFLKAIGMGLNVPINEVEILDDKISWCDEEWHLQEIKLDEKYISYLASNIPFTTILIEKMSYN